MNLNIRNKLLIFAVLAVLVPLGLTAVVILPVLSSLTNARSTEEIRSDARTARSFFDKRTENLKAAAQSVAQSVGAGRGLPAAAQPAESGATPASGAAPAPARGTQNVLEKAREASAASFVALLDTKGKVIAQHNGAPVGDGMYLAENKLVADVNNRAQAGDTEPAAQAVIEEAAVVEAFNLKDAAAVAGVTQGMFLEAAAPVYSGDTFSGVVLIGQLINNDHAVAGQSIVNEIKSTLYGVRDDAAVVVALSDGSANTIISTNLPDPGGVATGKQVKDSGGTADQPSYQESVEFPNGLYRTSFVPIEGVDRTTGVHTVGLIGVAIKDEWFTAIVRPVQLVILIVSLVALLLAVAGAVVAAQRLTRPIVELTEAANRISLGELDVPISVESNDEIGTLAESLDRMRISLKQAIERLRKR